MSTVTAAGGLAAAARAYRAHASALSPAARLFLLAATLGGLNSGVQSVLLNLYVLALGYDAAFLGRLLRFGPLAALPAALLAGPLTDTWGPRRALLAGTGLAASGGVLFLTAAVPAVLQGGLALASAGAVVVYVAANPFMARHSSPGERTHLFVFVASAYVISTAVGSVLGGQLPGIIAAVAGGLSRADVYRLALLTGGLLSAIGIPLLVAVREAPPVAARPAGGAEAGTRGARRRRVPQALVLARTMLHDRGFRRVAAQFVVADALIRVGGNLVVPYFNVLFVRSLGASEASYGWLRFAERALQVGATLLAAPLAARYGPVLLVVVTQLLSVPMLLGLGFAPTLLVASGAFLFRGTLMDMTIPVRDSFLMAVVPAPSRATMNALLLVVGQAIAVAVIPLGGALLQAGHNDTAYMATAALYVASAVLYWQFFVHLPAAAPVGRAPGQQDPAHESGAGQREGAERQRE